MKKIILITLLLLSLTSCGEEKIKETEVVDAPIIETPSNEDSIVAIEKIKADTPVIEKVKQEKPDIINPLEKVKSDSGSVIKMTEIIEKKPSVFQSIKDKILNRNKSKTKKWEEKTSPLKWDVWKTKQEKEIKIEVPLEQPNQSIKTDAVITKNTEIPVIEKSPEPKIEAPKVIEKTPELIKKEETKKKRKIFPKLEKNIKKLKQTNISSEEVEQINQAVESAVVKAVSETATTTDNIEVCNALDENFIEGCKKEVILENAESDSECEQLSESGSVDSCKNTFHESQALEESNVALCDRILNPAWILACKNRVFLNIAKVSLDESVCEQLSETFEKQECKRQIKTEIQLKKEHDNEIQKLKDNFQNQDN